MRKRNKNKSLSKITKYWKCDKGKLLLKLLHRTKEAFVFQDYTKINL